jgi:hypothetical protein
LSWQANVGPKRGLTRLGEIRIEDHRAVVVPPKEIGFRARGLMNQKVSDYKSGWRRIRQRVRKTTRTGIQLLDTGVVCTIEQAIPVLVNL